VVGTDAAGDELAPALLDATSKDREFLRHKVLLTYLDVTALDGHGTGRQELLDLSLRRALA
jgi:hypothetical protein